MASQLDYDFQKDITQIQKSKIQLNKHLRIRVDQWLKKLKQKVTLNIWKKNRNSYSQLLASCVKLNKLVSPFDRVPPQGSLPQLQQHQIKQKLSHIKNEKFTNIYHKKFLKQAKQRQNIRQLTPIKSKSSAHFDQKLLINKTPKKGSNNYSYKQKNTKQTSIEISQIHELTESNPDLLIRISKFIKKYNIHYQHDNEYKKLQFELSKQMNEIVPILQLDKCQSTESNPLKYNEEEGFESNILQ